MKLAQEAIAHYQNAYAQARRILLEKKKLRMPLTPFSLNTILNESTISHKEDMGVLEIPTNLISGVDEESECSRLYTKEFLPVSAPASDYAAQWCRLYRMIQSGHGFRKPIFCYEYLGRFYVRDGMKRVSVANAAGMTCIRAHVIRILPRYTDDPACARYYSFLFQYRLTKLYQIQFTQPGFFAEFQSGLGFKPAYRWTGRDRTYFLSRWNKIEDAFHKSYADSLLITAADALVILMRKYSFEQIASMESWMLAKLFLTFWKEFHARNLAVQAGPMAAGTADTEQSA